MTQTIRSTLLILLVVLPVVASDQEEAAADTVARAFLQARRAAHRSKLDRMGRNTFREKVCQHDLRFPSGWINDVVDETSDPAGRASGESSGSSVRMVGNPIASN